MKKNAQFTMQNAELGMRNAQGNLVTARGTMKEGDMCSEMRNVKNEKFAVVNHQTSKRPNLQTRFARWGAAAAAMLMLLACPWESAWGAIHEDFDRYTGTGYASTTSYNTYADSGVWMYFRGMRINTTKTGTYAYAGSRTSGNNSGMILTAFNASRGVGTVSFGVSRWGNTAGTVTVRVWANGNSVSSSITPGQAWSTFNWSPKSAGTSASVQIFGSGMRFIIDEFYLDDAGGAAEVKWLGNSYIVLNGSWYNGSGSGNTALPSSLGTITSLSIGGEIQNWVTGNAENKANATLNYQIDSGDWTPLAMKWYKKPENNNYYHTLTSGSDMTAQTVDISGMAAGTHTLKVYFSQDTSATSVNDSSVNGLSGGKIFDSNGGNNYVVSFDIAATLSRTPTSLSGFSTESGTASDAQSFSVTATHLSGNLTVTAPTGYEVSTTSGTSGFSGSVTLSRDANNKVTAQTVWVRLKSDAAVGSRTGNVTVSGGGTTQVTVGLTGGVTPKPPTKGTVSYPSNEAEGRVVIPWTKNTAGNDVMVVRVANNGTAPSPANGTSYSQGGTLGSGQIVYKGSATSYKDTGLTAGTDYDYYLFSVSGNYYSTGVKVDATASKAPRFGTTSVSKSTTVGSSASNTQTASGTPSSMTYSVTCTAGGATTGFSVNGSGVFSFAPTAAGSYTFKVSAANGVTAVSASSYTISVTVTAAAPTVGSPSRSATTAVGATLGGTVSSTGGQTVTEWGVVFSATSANTDPTVGGTGCTNVTASGTPGESAFTAAVTGLKANTEYKWKAYAVNSVGTGYTAVQTFTTPCMSAGPVVTPEGINGGARFTWADVGAVQYLLSLWTGGASESLNYTFTSDAEGWTLSTAYREQDNSDYGLRIGSGSAGGTAASPVLGFTGNATLTFKAWVYNTDSSCVLYVDQNDGSGWNTLTSTPLSITASSKAAASLTEMSLTGVTASSQIRFRTTTSKKRVRVDDVTITHASQSYVTGYGAAGGEVTSPATVSGLTPGTTYNWSLKAVGGGTGCEATGTPYGTNTYVVTPTADPEPDVEVSEGGSAIGATVDWGTREIAGGAVTKTFTVENTGDADLESLGDPTLGTGGQGFTVSAMGDSSLEPDDTTTFTVTFTPAAAMSAGVTKTDTVSFDWDGNTYTFTVTATVPAAVVESTQSSMSGFQSTVGYAGSNTKQTSVSGSHLTTANVTVTLSDTGTWEMRQGTSGSFVAGPINLAPSSGSVASTVIQVRLKNGATAGNKTGTLTIAGGGASGSVVVNLSGTVYPMPTPNPNHAEVTVARGVEADLDLSDYVTHHASYSYSLTTTPAGFEDYYFDDGTGDMMVETSDAGVYAFVITIANTDGKSATFTWTVTVGEAPGVTKGTESASGTTATVPATVNAGGLATTVTFKYGTAEGTYNLNPASTTGSPVAAGATAGAVSASLTSLTPGTTYYYQWTAVNDAGTTVVTGSFFQPGDNLEFPADMNGWAQGGTTTRDAQFGGCYYTAAYHLTAVANPNDDPEFKEYKAGTWRGGTRDGESGHPAKVYVNGDGDGSAYRYTDGANDGNNRLRVAYSGYYTLRGRSSGSGNGLSVEYVAMFTEGAPVEITGASDNHETQGTAGVTVTATLSAAPSSSEKVYVRYSTDGWATWALRQMSVSGSTATYTIDGMGKGTTVEYYILTSPHAYVGTDPDLCTLRGHKSGTTNYCYTTTLLPPRNATATAGYEKVDLGWNLNAAGSAVMIVRYDGTSPSVTAPSDGTAYAADTSALGGFVVYGAYADTGANPSLANVVSQGTGYTYVLYSVQGSGNASKYSAGVTLTATTKALSTPTVLVDATGYVTWGATTVRTGEKFVVARCDGSDGFSGTPSGGEPSVGTTPFCGGKVVYVGTGDNFTDSGVVGCQTYYYKAWLKAPGENAWSSGSAVASETMDEPGTPSVTGTSSTDNSITINFSAADRADGYRLSVWTGGSGTEGTITNVANDGVASTEGWDYIGGASVSGSGSSAYHLLMSSSTPGLKSPEFSTVGYSSVTLKARSRYYGAAKNLIVAYSINDGGWTNIATFTDLTGSYADKNVALPAAALGQARVRVKWYSSNATSTQGTRLQEVAIVGVQSRFYVSGYDANGASVSPTSATVGSVGSPLASGTTYNYSLWAIGNSTSCAGTPTTGTVTTTGTQAPGTPTVSGSSSAAGSVSVTVTAGSPAPAGTEYVVYRFTDGDLAGSVATPTAAAAAGGVLVGDGVAAGTFTDSSGVVGCTTYYYVGWADNSGVLSAASAVGSVRTATVGAPGNLDEVSVGPHGAVLSWDAPAGGGASGYAVDVWHVEGGTKTAVYTLDWASEDEDDYSVNVTASGAIPDGATESFSSGYGMIVGDRDTATLTLNGYAGQRITGVTLLMSSYEDGETGEESGAGSFTMKVGSTTIASIADSSFSSANWNGAWSYAWVDITPAVTATTVGAGDAVTLKIQGSEDVLYVQKFTITYEGTGRVYDVEDNVGVGGVTCTVAGTGATVAGLQEGTPYGWSVAAVGGDCTGSATTDADGFTTAEMVGAPTIGALTPGVGSLGGRVTGTAGATLVLKRYENEAAALAATATSAMGGVPVDTVETGVGTGVWDFSNTGLDGCKTYYYRAWQRMTISGVEYTSKGSTVVGAQTVLGTPSVTAVGAGTQILLSWGEVKGATSYDVEVSSSSTFTPGAATTRVSEDFDAKNPSGWSFSGTDWYGSEGANNSGQIYGGSGFSVKFDNDGDKATTPTFTAGATSLSFWMKATSTGSSLTIEALESGSWNTVTTLSAGTTGGGETVDLSEHTTATQLRFTINKSGGNIGLDHVTVTGPGSGGTIVFTTTVTAEPYTVTVPGLAQNTEYWYRVTAHGSESCADKTAEGSQRTADGPLIKVTPKRYDFGTVNKGEGGKTVKITVRNDGNQVLSFTSVALVQAGTYYSITLPETAAGRTADIAVGGSREYTVKYDPQASGTHTAVLRFLCNALNADEVEGESYRILEVPLTGRCNDPATADPTVYWMEVEDELGIEDTVTDHSMAQEADEPVLRVLAYHFNRIYQELDGSTWAAKWTLRDPAGDVVVASGGVRLENRPFTAVENRAYDGAKACTLFSAPIPALGDGNAVRGTYGVEVTVWDAGKNHRTTTTNFVPIEQGWLFEDFTRANVVADGTGKLEQGWTAMASGGAAVNEVEIRDESLVMYGRSDAATKAAGRLAVARNMGDVGYATRWTEFTGEGSWGFHFRTEAKTMGWDGNSLAGAFVLGSTEGTWLRSSVGQAGVAVLMENDGVRLAKFTGSLLADASLTQIGTATWTNSTKGKTLAVRVDYIPGQEELSESESGDGEAHAAVPARMRLYVKEVAGMGGDPTKECTGADKVLEADVPDGLTGDLRFGGMVWNHGTTDAGMGSAGVFDDIYLPHTDGQGEPMRFHVIDEDTVGPVFEGFNVPAAVAATTVQSEGLAVTGLVCDASGIWINASGASWDSGAAAPKWELWVNDTKKSEGTLTAANCTPSANGGGTNVAVSFSIPSGLTLAETTNCVLKLSAWDHDTDRSDDSMEGTAELRFTLCAETPRAPAWATLEGDGAEMAVLRWARVVNGEEEGNYVVVRGDAEIGAGSPIPQGTNAVAAGKTWPGVGTVVYAGNGENHLRSGTWQAREFVVPPSSTNYFAVFGMSGSAGTGFYFSSPTKPTAYHWTTTATNADTGAVTVTAHTATNSSGVPVAGSVTDGAWPLVTPKYEPGEGIDAFAYRTSVPDPADENPQGLALTYAYETRPATGSGWAPESGWTGDTDVWKIHDGSLLTFGTGYPTPAANKLYWHDEAGNGSAARLTRQLGSEYSGDFFVAAILNYKLPEDNSPKQGKWVNIALMNGDTELVSFGKVGGTDEATATYATIYATDLDGQPHNTTSESSVGRYDLNPGHGNDYIVVGQVSREDKTFRLWAFTGANDIPELFKAGEGTSAETQTAMKQVRASWSWAGGAYDSWNKAVTGIRLQAGSTVSEPIGHVYFDEVRFAGSWEELFLFNKPEVDDYTLGANCGTNEEDQVIWKISDGELAHADVAWTNVQFDLYHRTGVEYASFTVLDENGRVVLMEADDDNLAGSDPGTAELTQGRNGMWTSDAAGTAVAKADITLTNEYTVQVWMQSSGGRTNTVTSSTGNVGNGGATDLFFGEFGEGQLHDKYVELYNGMNQSIDLSQYVIARGYKGESGSTNYLENRWYKWAFVSAEPYWMKPRSTIVLINQMSETARLEKMTGRLDAKGCQHLSMTNDVLDSGGSAPIILLSKDVFVAPDANGRNANSPTNKPWIDACGASDSIAKNLFIMSRKATATPLPRSNLPVSTDDWEYRNWSKTTDDYSDNYDDFITTAGENQQKMGLGGEMKFTVFDDDTVGPSVNAAGSGVIVKSQGATPEEHRGVTPGSNVYVQAAWTFTPAAGAGETSGYTEEQWNAILSPWDGGQTTRGSVTWDPALGTRDAMVKTDGGQSGAELNGDPVYATGCLYVKCNRGFSKGQEVWIGFDMDMKSMTNRMVSFGYKGTATGFENGWVEWSTSGSDGWTQATNWPVLAPRTDKYTDWSGDMDAAGVPADAGHLWFRIVLRDYDSQAGAFYMDNFRVEGAPDEVVVTDAEVCERGLKFVVEVRDEASGLDAGASGHGSTLDTGARFVSGLGNENQYRDVGGLKNSAGVAMSTAGAEPDPDGKWGRGAGGTITWTAWDAANDREMAGGYGAQLTEEWFQKTSAGEGQLKVTIADADDDRANDETETTADFGMLSIVDDDDEMPVLELSSMKPRKGTWLARWRITESGSKAPTKVAEGLSVDDLACQAVGGSETTPKTVLYDTEADGTKLYALKQTGWMYNSKYWRVRIRTGAEPVVVTNIAFVSRVSSVLAPPTFTVVSVPSGSSDGESVASGDLGGGGEWDPEEVGSWYPCETGEMNVELPGNATSELRIFGTGVTATNFSAINAVWAVFDLQVFGYVKADGGEGEESEAYTYVTDNEMASGSLPALTGYLYDTGSGLSWTDNESTRLTNNPHLVMTKGVKTGVTQELAFASAPAAGGAGRRDAYSTNNLSDGGATDRASGAFTAPLPVSAAYTTLSLDEYAGTIHAFDADADRADSSGRNVDRTEIESEFGFTVIDQDVTRPAAPGSVKVNGAEFRTSGDVLQINKAAPGEAENWVAFNRETAAWTNGPEFLVTFTAADDQVPTAEQWSDSTWTNANVVGLVKKQNKQSEASGVGEYRVALADTAAGRAAALAYSVAATNGALANYGFENYAVPNWTHDDPGTGTAVCGINMGTAVGGTYPLGEGTNSYYLRAGYRAWQVISWTNTDASAPVVLSGSAKVYKRAQGSRVFVKAEVSATEDFTSVLDQKEWQLTVGTDSDEANQWLSKTMDEATLSDSAGASFLRVSLRTEGNNANIDDVRLSVKKGTVQPSMKYVARNAAAQGLAGKFLYAVDADNDRVGDRLEGHAAEFHTSYDITPPTAVEFHNTTASGSHGNGALTSDDDPTTQFDLVWVTKKTEQGTTRVVVGPDNPDARSVYNSIPQADIDRAGRDNDVLSPWGSYKVYYRTYDPVAIETAAAEAPAGTTVADYLYKTLVQDEDTGTAFYKDASLGWKWIQNGDKIDDPSANASGILRYTDLDKVLKPGAPASVATNGMRLYDLEFDQEYLVVIAGVDAAGNEGPVTATSWATNNTIRFALIKGWHTNRDDAVTALARTNILSDTNILTGFTNRMVSAMQWIAAGNSFNTNTLAYEGAVSKDYDLLKWDARGFQERPDNPWEKIATVKTNWFVDDGGPTNRGAIRFYRASYKDRWKRAVTNTSGQVTTQTPLVSEEVYAQTAVPLRAGPGQNFTALHGVPYTNTLRGVFGGTNEFPGGNGESNRTWITFYPPGETQIDRNSNDAVDVYWLNTNGVWRKKGDNTTDWSDKPLDTNLFTRAFSIDLPEDLGNYAAGTHTIMHGTEPETFQYMLWKPILQVPTNGFERVIECPTNGVPKFNIVALRLPVAAHPSQMHLAWAITNADNSVTWYGMRKGDPWDADEIYTIDPITKEPGHSCYCDSSGTWKFVSGGNVPWGYFKPNDILVIVSKNRQPNGDTSWKWTYNPADFYTLPNRHMLAE